MAAALRIAIGLPTDDNIFPEDMQGLTRLTASNRSIADLTGLETATGLTDLTLSTNNIVDLEPLEALTRLEMLNLSDNQIVDLEPLEALTSLETLDLSNNQITDVAPLADLTNLTLLYLTDNAVVNPGALYHLDQQSTTSIIGVDVPDAVTFTDTNLEAAVRQTLRIATADPILPDAMATLTRLTASRRDITSLAGLETAGVLERLDVGQNEISDLEPLRNLTLLTYLDVADNQITNVSALSGLTNLQTLDLRNNDVTDTALLSTMTHLRYLYVRGNDNLDSLKQLVKLTEAGTRVDITLPRPVTFRDDNLLAALRTRLGLQTDDPIFPEDMETLTTFSASHQSIANLTGLETATALIQLTLSNNQISSLSPLSRLTSLQTLDLANNQISSISSLSNLTHLTTLNLNSNRISSVSSLSRLSNLTTLNLSMNQIRSLSSLSGLTTLTELDLSDNQITDVLSLQGLSTLRRLNLEGNTGLTQERVSVLYKLGQAGTIVTLPQGITLPTFSGVVAFNNAALEAAVRSALRITNGYPILTSKITDLTSLTATRKAIDDLTGLEAATGLTRLDLGDNAIVNLEPLRNLTTLTRLDLAGNQIVNVSPLSNLTNLTSLDLDNNQIQNVSPLSGLSSIEALDLRYNDVGDVTPLSQLTTLTQLYLYRNENLTNVKQLVKLKEAGTRIDIRLPTPINVPDTNLAVALRTQIGLPTDDDIFPEDMEGLTRLTASNHSIADLTGLETATGLTDLTLSNNDIIDLTLLSALTNLERLDLSNNAITDVSPLADLTNLQRLNLTGNDDITNLGTLYHLDQQTTTTIIGVDVPDAVVFTDTNLEAAVKQALRIATVNPILPDAIATLTRLTASRKNITSLVGLEQAGVLETLDAGQNEITDLTPLSGLTRLERLDVADNEITDVSALSGLTNLQTLDLRNNQITDVTPLKDLINLTYIYLRGNENLTNLEWLGALEKLRSDTRLPDVVRIPDTNLDAAVRTELRIAGNTVSNELPMSEELLESLETLTASNRNIADLTGCEHMTELTSLDLRNNQITDVTPLSKLYSLETLKLAGNTILDTSPLYGLLSRNLSEVDITINRYPSWDVNQDGDVNKVDLYLVTLAITGSTPDINEDGAVDALDEEAADVNQDGSRDINDLRFVFDYLDRPVNLSAPSSNAETLALELSLLERLDAEKVRVQLQILHATSDGTLQHQQAIAFLQEVLTRIQPNQTRLLPNYPNPFNPETWIPYQLARGSDVRITIYDTQGAVVRHLELGYRAEGYYTTRGKAAHWDGRNDIGERVASGIYFYQLETDDVSLLRKMVILK